MIIIKSAIELIQVSIPVEVRFGVASSNVTNLGFRHGSEILTNFA